MKLDKRIKYNRIEIFDPRYKDQWNDQPRVVLIAPWNIADHNIVWFSKAKYLMGREFYVSGDDIRSCEREPITSKKGTTYQFFAVPFTMMQEIQDDADQAWDKMVDEYEQLKVRVEREQKSTNQEVGGGALNEYRDEDGTDKKVQAVWGKVQH